VPVEEGLLTRDNIDAKIGDVITGKAKGRISDEDITVFDSTGLAVQDVVTAWKVYQKALERNIGSNINFLD
jgi:alanine dehydrogenase